MWQPLTNSNPKPMKKTHHYLCALLVGAVLLFNACSQPAVNKMDPRIAMVPNADAALYFDVATMDASAFAQAVDKVAPEKADKLPEEFKKMQEILNITKDDISAIAASVSHLEAMTQQDFTDAAICVAVQVKKVVTTEQLEELLKQASSEGQGTNYEVEDYKGQTLFNDKESQDAPFPVALTVINDETQSLFILGKDTSVKEALDRIEAGSIVEDGIYKQAMDAQLTQQQGWLLVSLPTLAKNQLENLSVNPTAAMFLGPEIASLAGIYQIGVTTSAAEALQLQIYAKVNAAEDATGLKNMLDRLLSTQGKVLSQQQLGRVVDTLENLSTEAKDNEFRLNTSITVEDVMLMYEKTQETPLPVGP